MSYVIEVAHTIDAAHRVLGHRNADGSAGKCSRLHGHTYAFDITLTGDELDDTGFVVDFGKVKALLDRWDHRTLLWDRDPWGVAWRDGDDPGVPASFVHAADSGIVYLPFNPTAENMAAFVAEEIIRSFDEVNGAEVAVRETAKTCARVLHVRGEDTAELLAWPMRKGV